ncbi:MAG: hypothetical protein U0176_15650 [Bacteroidia bacterium]
MSHNPVNFAHLERLFSLAALTIAALLPAQAQLTASRSTFFGYMEAYYGF